MKAHGDFDERFKCPNDIVPSFLPLSLSLFLASCQQPGK